MSDYKIMIEVGLGEQDLSDKKVRKLQRRLGRVVGDTLLGARVDGLLEFDYDSVLIGIGPTEDIDRETLEILQGTAVAKEEEGDDNKA